MTPSNFAPGAMLARVEDDADAIYVVQQAKANINGSAFAMVVVPSQPTVRVPQRTVLLLVIPINEARIAEIRATPGVREVDVPWEDVWAAFGDLLPRHN